MVTPKEKAHESISIVSRGSRIKHMREWLPFCLLIFRSGNEATTTCSTKAFPRVCQCRVQGTSAVHSLLATFVFTSFDKMICHTLNGHPQRKSIRKYINSKHRGQNFSAIKHMREWLPFRLLIFRSGNEARSTCGSRRENSNIIPLHHVIEFDTHQHRTSANDKAHTCYVKRVKLADALKICDGIIFKFYPGLPHIRFKKVALRLSLVPRPPLFYLPFVFIIIFINLPIP